MDKFPVEIWAQIFRWCLPSFEIEQKTTRLQTRKCTPEYAPLLLCQVSSFWRNITLSTPCLWTLLEVHLSSKVARPSIELASRWLARSRSQPLSLELIQISPFNESGCFLELFQEHTSHWQHVRLSIPSHQCRPWNKPNARSAPMLEAFQTSTDIMTGPALDTYFEFFGDAPQLSRLRVASLPNLDASGRTAVSVPWSQLTHLTTRFASFHDAMQVLELCNNLVELDMVVLKLGPTRNLEEYQIKQATLSSLTICGSADLLLLVFGHLRVPNLKTLVVSEVLWGPVVRWLPQNFCSFLTVARDILRLELLNVGMTEFTGYRAIANLQKLETLIITENKNLQTGHPLRLDILLRLFTWFDSVTRHSIEMGDQVMLKEEACPNLETFIFNGGRQWGTEGTLADMVESRWRYHGTKVAKLKCVEICVPDLPLFCGEDCRRLKEFEEEGLELELNYL